MGALSAGSDERITASVLAFCVIIFVQGAGAESLPVSLFQRWFHSYEDDTAEILVFRPSGYSFPPARGRDGFEIRPNGIFTLIGPGGNDRSTAITGRWVHDQNRTLQVTFSDSSLNREIHIVDVKPQLLRVRR